MNSPEPASSPLGVLLTNLGTPDAPTAPAVRRYLRDFLSDPRVVDLPRVAWNPVLYGFILPLRPRRSAAAYAKIWQPEGSPLLVHSLAQRDALQAALDARLDEPAVVALGMRYGKPSIGSALDELRRKGCRRLVVLPLYPQFSATTTASTFDAVARAFSGWRDLPAFSFINDYYDRPDYISALAASVREFRAAHGSGGKLLLSFHGLPQRNVDAGDPYERQCRETGARLAAALGLGDNEWMIAFQSRLGAAAWLKPYTADTVREWGRAGIKTIDVICPGFPADCLETLEEIAIRNGEYFRDAGGDSLRYIPALNARDDHIAALANMIESYNVR
ncbi:MAG TPA: ferrochelatase [Gammaproteobacteria bacterium]|jgi:ferrochelatase|nr:ferrochelatase [Gammaproteobacteria bacterium]HET7587962.1 ferrochelatase [Gammaproteobacteria bacterium]